jgi:hypothetical protein
MFFVPLAQTCEVPELVDAARGDSLALRSAAFLLVTNMPPGTLEPLVSARLRMRIPT